MNVITARLNKKSCDRYSIFDKRLSSDKLIGLTSYEKDISDSVSINPHEFNGPYISYPDLDNLSCSICQLSFDNHSDFKSHYQLESHTANEKRIAKNSNLSKNMTKDSFTIKNIVTESGRKVVLLKNRYSELVCVLKCVLYTGNNLPSNEDALLKKIEYFRCSKRWSILMYTSGKFAGAIFDENKPIAHKVIRRYTIRAKQGGAQSQKDKSCGGMGGPKSAGANLRRYNEQAMKNDIGTLLHSKWMKLLHSCDLIFFWSSKCNLSIFHSKPSHGYQSQADSDKELSEEEFKGDVETLVPSPLSTDASRVNLGFTEKDERIRHVPYQMYNVTFNRLKEIHNELSHYELYDESAKPDLIRMSERKQLKHLSESGDKVLQISQSGRYFNTPLNYQKKNVENWLDKTTSEPAQEESADRLNDSRENSVRSLSDDEFLLSDDFPEDEREETDSPEQVRAKEMSQRYEQWYRKILVAISANDVELFLDLLPEKITKQNSRRDSTMIEFSKMGSCGLSSEEKPKSNEEAKEMLNMFLGDGRTLLHVAVECQAEPSMLTTLLLSGCNPSLKNSQGHTIYTVCQNLGFKQITKALKNFRKTYPDLYDYSQSDIPSPLSSDELNEKKLKKEALKTKLNEKKKIVEAKELARQEEARFAMLSDREKRALAAERRIMKNKEANNSLKCEKCQRDMTGMVPFTYSNFVFCSSNCMRSHRLDSRSS